MAVPRVPKVDNISNEKINSGISYANWIEKNGKKWTSPNPVEITNKQQEEYDTWYKEF